MTSKVANFLLVYLGVLICIGYLFSYSDTLGCLFSLYEDLACVDSCSTLDKVVQDILF